MKIELSLSEVKRLIYSVRNLSNTDSDFALTSKLTKLLNSAVLLSSPQQEFNMVFKNLSSGQLGISYSWYISQDEFESTNIGYKALQSIDDTKRMRELPEPIFTISV